MLSVNSSLTAGTAEAPANICNRRYHQNLTAYFEWQVLHQRAKFIFIVGCQVVIQRKTVTSIITACKQSIPFTVSHSSVSAK